MGKGGGGTGGRYEIYLIFIMKLNSYLDLGRETGGGSAFALGYIFNVF